MPNRDERITESGASKHQSGRDTRRAYGLLSRAYLRRLFIVLAIALATVLMNIPVKTVAQQQDDGSSNGSSALTVTAPNIEPTEADLAAGVVISRLDTRQVGVKGLPAAEYDLVLQADAEGKFHLHAIEVGSKTVYADVVTPELVDTPTGKELNIDLPGTGSGGQDLRIPIRICVTVTVHVTIYGIQVPISATVCVTVNIG